MQDVKLVVDALQELAALLELSGEPKFKVNAFERAAEVVNTVGVDLALLVEQDRLQELQGIGRTLSRQIQELWNTGQSDLLTRLRAEHPAGAGELVQIEGMTARRIRALHDALGIRRAEELRDACIAGRVRTVPGFGEKTERRLLVSCQRWLERGAGDVRPLLLAPALHLGDTIERELLSVGVEAHLAGALRRGEELITELELVVLGDRARALAHLAKLRSVLRVDAERGVAHLSEGLRMTIHAADPTALGNELVRATGSGSHVQALESRAARRGFGLWAPSPRIHGAPETFSLPARRFVTERALYDAIGLAYVPPEQRDDVRALEHAERGDFDDLLETGDIQGMVHCHTDYSDGKSTIAEMALAAEALGMQYITITDHSPSAHYAGGVTLDRLKQQWDEIAAAQETVRIRILRGTESDILADGQLDYPDDILERFDVIIASIHARHRMDRNDMTQRLTRAMALPVFKIWGHGLGRILNHRPPIDCDVPAVLDALAGSRGAIEINADPHRLDLPPAWVPAARARGIPFVISVDAHSTRGLGVLRYGVIMARRGGLRKNEVLNALSANAFADRVRPV